jgi:type II secretory ATPase GspE/PulE/Tfp pilus assembly ATPase PilB-like protein
LNFNDEIQNHTFNDEQLQIFELLIKQPIRLHILEGTHGNGKTIFIKYFTQYLHMQNKNVLLTTIIGAVVL